MNGPQRRVVISGVGMVSPLGTGNDVFWQNLIAGKSGVKPIHAFATDGKGTAIAAEVRDFEPKNYVKQRKSLKVMARDIQLAVGAAQITIDDAALDTTKLDPTRFGVNCGAAMIATDLAELAVPVEHSINGTRKFDLKKWGAEGMEQLFPLWMLKYLPNMPACHISITYDAQGPNNSITTGEASSTLAMGEAYRILGRGGADLFITGGSDSKINPLSIVRLALLNRLSKRADDPAAASRPFDAGRDGMVAGEGSALMIFEEAEHAKKRNAKIYAEVVGFGSACQPRDRSQAVEKAAARALHDAGLTPGDLGHIVAHGSSCVDEDRDEAIGLGRLLGDHARTVPIIAYKSYLGHASAANGAIDLAASVLALAHHTLVPTKNYQKPDPALPPLRFTTERMECPAKPFLTIDFSPGGQAAALVIKPYEE